LKIIDIKGAGELTLTEIELWVEIAVKRGKLKRTRG